MAKSESFRYKNKEVMREIKFRAWIERDKKLFYQGDQYLISFLRRANSMAFESSGHDSYGSAPLQQFTGLKDKNEKEIYEGDIVNLHGNKTVIEFKITNEKISGHGDSSTTTYVGYSLGFYGTSNNFFGECEVIGNIYQHPELLPK